ncbi:hypothetical protein D3C85_1762750 [compost metagenome]
MFVRSRTFDNSINLGHFSSSFSRGAPVLLLECLDKMTYVAVAYQPSHVLDLSFP